MVRTQPWYSKLAGVALLATGLGFLAMGIGGAAFGDSLLPPPLTGNVYVSGSGSDGVFCYDPAGEHLFTFSHSDLDGPRGLAFASATELYVGSEYSDRILVFDENGAYLRQFTAPGLDGPTSLAFGPDGKLYVSSFNTDEVFVFDDETFERTFTAEGLNGPNCVAFADTGKIFVASQLDNRVYRFDSSGSFEIRFTGGGVSSPMGIAIYAGKLYLTGGSSNTVAIFDLEGNFLENLSTNPPISGPQGIAFDDAGNFVTASFFSGAVACFRPDGTVVKVFDEVGIRVARSVAYLPLPLEELDFVRGDFNRDGGVDISDSVGVLGHLFRDEATEGSRRCLDAGDANDDGAVDLSDAVYGFSYLFLGGGPPSPPFPQPGPDPTEDSLTCR